MQRAVYPGYSANHRLTGLVGYAHPELPALVQAALYDE